MCGITGYYLRKNYKQNSSAIGCMHSVQVHRGPQDWGYSLFDANLRTHLASYSMEEFNARKPQPDVLHNIALASRRLKIIDLTANGHQPMFTTDKKFCVVFNGEIYNYVELKKELLTAKINFCSSSDTEVLLKSYQYYGKDFVKKFNGMWAFALYDMLENKIIISRDRFGVKPLYYYIDENIFVFASELKSLLILADVPRNINHSKIINFITKGYRFLDNDFGLFFNNIRQLQPSSSLTIDLNSDNISIEKYWKLTPLRNNFYVNSQLYDNKKAKKDIEKQYLELLINAVDIRLRSDVKYAFCLSGGMDSTSIASITAKILKRETTTFTACYENEVETAYDEKEFVDAVINDTNCVNHRIHLKLDDFFSDVIKMISFHDEPVCTVTFFSNWHIMSKVKNTGFTVFLNGNGADESLAGYYDYYMYNMFDLSNAGQNEKFEFERDSWINNHGKKIEQYEAFLNSPYDRSYFYPNGNDYIKIFKAEYYLNYSYPFIETPFSENMLINRMYNDLMHEGFQALLRADDRNAMAFSLEARSPFLDYRLFEFAYSLPNCFKINGGIGKHLLRESMRGILCEKVRTRKEKVGFNAPFVSWLKKELKNPIHIFFSSKELEIYKYMKQNVIMQKLKEHNTNKANHMMLFWNLINIELWLRYIKSFPVLSALKE